MVWTNILHSHRPDFKHFHDAPNQIPATVTLLFSKSPKAPELPGVLTRSPEHSMSIFSAGHRRSSRCTRIDCGASIPIRVRLGRTSRIVITIPLPMWSDSPRFLVRTSMCISVAVLLLISGTEQPAWQWKWNTSAP
jgi:hypothetical protein